jgi:DNA polymerase IIIc chi subunit
VAKKSKSADVNFLAHQIVVEATNEEQTPISTHTKEKNPAAIAQLED